MEMSAANDVPVTLLGKDIIFSEKVGPLGSTGDLMLVNFGWYVLGDRQTLQVATSEEYLFANDMVAYRMIERLDGRCWLQSPITPYNGSSKTLSFAAVLTHDRLRRHDAHGRCCARRPGRSGRSGDG